MKTVNKGHSGTPSQDGNLAPLSKVQFREIFLELKIQFNLMTFF